MAETNPIEALNNLHKQMVETQTKYDILAHSAVQFLGLNVEEHPDLTVIDLVEMLAQEMGKPTPSLIVELKKALEEEQQKH